MTKPFSVTVLGGGSFGTAIANSIARNGFATTQWMRNVELAKEVQHTRINHTYLPDHPLHKNLSITSELTNALQESQLVFVSIPSASFREVIAKAKPFFTDDAMVVSTTKGISINKAESSKLLLMSEILKQEIPQLRTGVLSGPNFAKEIIQGQITGTVVASTDEYLIHCVQQALQCATMRIYSNNDVFGVELAGALKNIYAIIAGMAQSRHFGNNTMALLMTRALSEMGRFAHALGADPMTFLGLAGVGDLILTCGSNLSRNYQVGYAMGKGKSLTSAMREVGQVVEGVNTLRLVKEKADEMTIEMPLASALYALLFEGASPDGVIKQLMLSEQNSDVDFTGAIR